MLGVWRNFNRLLMKPIKIITFTPVWQRRKLFEIFLQGIKRLIKYSPNRFEIVPFFMISERYYAARLNEEGFDFIMINNNPLGAKKNEGLTYILNNYQFDYMLEIGSDDIIANMYLDIAEPYLKTGIPQMCPSRVYFLDILSGKIASHKTDRIVGLGRFISADALRMVTTMEPFWMPTADRGMDTYSWRVLARWDIDNQVIKSDHPILIDVKSEINLNRIDAFIDEIITVKELLKYFPEKHQIINLLNTKAHASNIF